MKKFVSLLSVLALLLVMTVPALASDMDLLYDATGLLENEQFTALAEAVAAKSDELQFEIRVDIVLDTQDYTIDEYAEAFYDTFSYGYGDTANGSLLMIRVHEENDGDLAFDDYALYFGGAAQTQEQTLRTSLGRSLAQYLSAAAWGNGIDEDRMACMNAIAVYVNAVSAAMQDVDMSAAGKDTAPASSEPGLDTVTDLAGLLTDAQKAELTTMAEALAAQYGCGVYILTVNDFTDYEGSQYGIYSFATTAFTQYNLGLGEDKNGVMLVLSMAERDYSLIAHGAIGNAAFTDHGKDILADEGFLPRFKINDWYGGFRAYVEGAGEFLRQNAQGTPFDIDTDPNYGRMPTGTKVAIIVIIPAIIAGIACMVMKSKMKSVALKKDANAYISQNGVALTDASDVYTHTTQTRVRIVENERSSGGHGGTSIGSGGFSGKSGKF